MNTFSKEEGSDVHQSKISPDDPRLKLNRPHGRSLNKSRVLVVALMVFLLLAILFVYSVVPKEQKAQEDPVFEKVIQNFRIPEMIRNAPAVIEEPIELAQAEGDGQLMKLVNDTQNDEFDQRMVRPPAPPVTVQAAQYQSQTYYQEPVVSEAEKEAIRQEQKAMTAGIFWADSSMPESTQMIDPTANLKQMMAQMQGSGTLGNGSAAGAPADSVARQNMQDEKKSFLAKDGQRDDNYVQSTMRQPVSPYEVKAGAVIPLTLITGINSDLPGEIIGQVRENVYDSVTGNHLLIPQGSRLMAAYDSSITFGQERVLLCWNRLIRPDGSSLNLECSPGIDLAGYSGVADEVDNHWWRLTTGVVFSSVLAATASTSKGNIAGENPTFGQVFSSNVGEEINSAGQQITQKNLNIQPTIKIRPGYTVNVMVNKDLILEPYR